MQHAILPDGALYVGWSSRVAPTDYELHFGRSDDRNNTRAGLHEIYGVCLATRESK